MSKSKDMLRLMQVTEAAYGAEQAKLAAITRHEDRLRTQISALNAKRHGAFEEQDVSLAAQYQAHFLWRSWIDRKITDLNIELARVLAAKSEARANLTRTFGRYQVAGHLFEQARIQSHRMQEKRSERDA